MLQDILAADGWREFFWMGSGGLAASALCFVGGTAYRAFRSESVTTTDPVDVDEREAPPAPNLRSQLEAVEGIGPRIAEHLRARGVQSFADLAALSPDALRSLLSGVSDLSLAQPMSWPLQAQLLETGQFEQFLNLAIALRAGVPSIMHVEGIGIGRAVQLRRQGIASIAALREADPSDLANWTGVSHAEAAQWVDTAGRLYDGDPALLAEIAEIELAAAPSTGTANHPEVSPEAPPSADAVPPSMPSLDDPGRRWSLRDCPQCCAATISALTLVGIGAAWIAGWIPEVTSPKPLIPPICDCPAPAKLHRQVLTDHLFDTDTVTLKDEALPLLDGLAADIRRQARDPKDLPGALVVIGHADPRRSRLMGGNQRLSERRAEAVADHLIAQLKVAGREWPNDLIFVLGRGDRDEHPKTEALCASEPNNRDYCLRYDRRVDVYAFYTDQGVVAAPPAQAIPGASPGGAR